MAPDERPRRAAVVVNPTKVDDVGALRELVTTTMVGAGWVCPLWFETTADDPGYAMTQEALREGVALVLVCGGDGTVRAVVTVLAGSGTPLALIPAGTGNLLARNFGLPVDDLEAALEVALTGDDRPIDVGRIEATSRGGREERFATMAGVGFDAEIMRDAPEQLKTRVGWPAYILSGARNLRGSSMTVQVRIDDGEPIRARARMIVVANVATLPGGMTLLPDARPDDGVLDVAIIISHNLMDWFRVWTRVITHRANVDQRYTTHQGKRIRIGMRSAQPRQMDGDLIEKGNQLTVQIEAAALLLRVPPAAREEPCGLVLDGRYRVESVLGRGGMATVYRAFDELRKQEVAIKLFPPSPDSDDLLRHQAEINMLSHLNHPGLVALFDAGSAYAGGPGMQTYIVMELVQGPTLARLLGTGPLAAPAVARIGSQLVLALGAAHDAQVIHRDVKPANVLLVDPNQAPGKTASAEGQVVKLADFGVGQFRTQVSGRLARAIGTIKGSRAAGRRLGPASAPPGHPVEPTGGAAVEGVPVVKLADFGIARLIDAARLTVTGSTMGTAMYLSPEQAAGSAVGPESDVYSLGLVLLECLTGTKAFSGSVTEVTAARLTSSPVIPPELGPEWVSLLTGMTQRDPAERMTTAEATALLQAISAGFEATAPTATTGGVGGS
jgi:diacylglycerol kinase (ATP)